MIRCFLPGAGAALAALLLLTGMAAAQADRRLAEASALVAEADAMWDGGDTASIETRLRYAVELLREVLEPGHPSIGATLARLCRNGFNARDFAAAEPACREALAIGERHAPQAFDTVRTMGDLAAVLRMQRRYAEAEPIVRRSLELRRAHFPTYTYWIASGLDNLARILIGQWRLDEARVLAEEAAALRRADPASGPAMTADAAALAAWLGDVLGYWRWLSERSLVLLAAGLVLATGAAFWTVRVERRGVPDGWEWLRSLLVLAGGAGFGIATAVAGALVLARWFPDTPSAGQIGKLAYLVGQAGGYLLAAGVANLLRRRAGLPRLPLLTPLHGPFVPRDPDAVGLALRRGKLRLYWPALLLFFASSVALLPFGAEIRAMQGSAPAIAVLVIPACLATSAAIAWLWWAVATPRWRVWALEAVEDIDALEYVAVAAQVIPHPYTRLGRLITKTEIWPPALRRKAQALRRGRGSAAWSGEL